MLRDSVMSYQGSVPKHKVSELACFILTNPLSPAYLVHLIQDTTDFAVVHFLVELSVLALLYFLSKILSGNLQLLHRQAVVLIFRCEYIMSFLNNLILIIYLGKTLQNLSDSLMEFLIMHFILFLVLGLVRE